MNVFAEDLLPARRPTATFTFEYCPLRLELMLLLTLAAVVICFRTRSDSQVHFTPSVFFFAIRSLSSRHAVPSSPTIVPQTAPSIPTMQSPMLHSLHSSLTWRCVPLAPPAAAEDRWKDTACAKWLLRTVACFNSGTAIFTAGV